MGRCVATYSKTYDLVQHIAWRPSCLRVIEQVDRRECSVGVRARLAAPRARRLGRALERALALRLVLG